MKVRIASVHFAPLHAERSGYNGVFNIPAVAVGADPVIYEIDDHVEILNEPVEGQNRRSVRRNLIEAIVIARDIVGMWTGKNGHSRLGCGPDSHPGVWIVRDRLPKVNADGTLVTNLEGKAILEDISMDLQRELFEEDTVANRAADANFANWLINDASGIASDPRQIKFIQPLARSAARAYQPNIQWLREGAQLQTTTCQYCTKPVLATAVKCPHCAEVINVVEWARLQSIQETALRSERSRRSAEEKALEKQRTLTPA